MRGAGRWLSLRLLLSLASALLAAWSAPAAAADPPPQLFELVHRFAAEPGRSVEVESKLRAHLLWLRQQGDPWRWQGWQQVTGDGAGSYVLRARALTWTQLDARSALERRAADRWAREIAPLLRSEVRELHLERGDLAREKPGAGPVLLSTNTFLLRYDRFAEFAAVLPKLAEAMKRSGYIYFRWSQLLNGGEQYILRMDFPKSSWSDNQPAAVPFWEMVASIHGEAEAARMRAIWFGSIARHVTGMEVYRAELSSPPG